ncbi:hypothetical protein GCM10027449_26300 [Sinomonas notoginsengisoli]
MEDGSVGDHVDSLSFCLVHDELARSVADNRPVLECFGPELFGNVSGLLREGRAELLDLRGRVQDLRVAEVDRVVPADLLDAVALRTVM